MSNIAAIADAINAAALNRSMIRFEYTKPRDDRPEPRCGVPEGPVWTVSTGEQFVTLFDPARGDYRNFALDRMEPGTVFITTIPESSCAARLVLAFKVLDARDGAASHYDNRMDARAGAAVLMRYGALLGMVLVYSGEGTRLLDRDDACAYLGIPVSA
jgi:hypothetical protein